MRVTITCDGRVVFDKEFVESEHPRNHGEFAKKGSGTSGTTGKSAHLVSAPADKERWPEHIKTLKLPPAWTDVHVSNDPDADLLAIGKDSKGRKQYVYAKRFADTNSAVKFDRIKELDSKMGEIRKQNDRALSSNDPSVREHAEVASLIMNMGLRPGGDEDTGAKVKAYGATTLEGRHVVSENGALRLRFVGKKGVAIDLPVEGDIAKKLLARTRQVGPNDKLFPNVTATSLLDYVHGFDGGGFKSKDFRTLLATSTAHALVANAEPPKDAADYKKKVREVAKVVSSKLGNTPTVALQSYISPLAFAPWRQHAEAA